MLRENIGKKIMLRSLGAAVVRNNMPEFLVKIDEPSRAEIERCLKDYGNHYPAKGRLSPASLAARIRAFLCELWPQLIDDPALMQIMGAQNGFADFGKNAEIGLLLCSNERIAEWNFRFRGQNRATDILSFPAESLGEGCGAGGDLLLSLPAWLDNCREFGCAPETELQRLLLHGLLHLFGLEHDAADSPSQAQSPMLQYQEAFLGFQRRTILPR